jgi:galactosylceramidase
MANYIVRFLQGAKQHQGLDIEYVGIWNETNYDVGYIKMLKKALLANGLATKIVAADGDWSIVDAMEKDPALKEVVYAMGVHYPGYDTGPGIEKGQPTYLLRYREGGTFSPSSARHCGKPLWASEDGPWRGDWKGAEELAKMYNRNYIEGKITNTEIWSPITSYYDNLPFPGSGLMTANTPWSGRYDVQPAVWATAHTTQFAQPGWQYIDSACGYLRGKGSYVTLKAPSSNDYSVVVETIDAGEPQEASFQITGGLSTGTIHLWQTKASKSFEKLSDTTPENGSFTIILEPDSIYSLTTTTGQARGSATVLPASPFPFPYTENFDGLAMGKSPKYFSDQSGAFEVTACAGRKGQCLRQVVNQHTIPSGGGTPDPFTYLGSPDWSDYKVSTDAMIEEPGYVTLVGRISADWGRSADWSQDSDVPWNSGYVLSVQQDGSWELSRKRFKTPKLKLASGKAPFSLKTWHHLTLAFKGVTVQAIIDGALVAKVTDETHKKGMVGIGTGWNRAQFDNFAVDVP